MRSSFRARYKVEIPEAEEGGGGGGGGCRGKNQKRDFSRYTILTIP
jgi:hypothetical protein